MVSSGFLSGSPGNVWIALDPQGMFEIDPGIDFVIYLELYIT